jgi:hypothetical protein
MNLIQRMKHILRLRKHARHVFVALIQLRGVHPVILFIVVKLSMLDERLIHHRLKLS